MDDKYNVSRAAHIPGVNQEMSCDVIGLQETSRSGQFALLQAGYIVYGIAAVKGVSLEAMGEG